ncbi:MAG TPA: hypothetical protein VFK40_02150 [Nitrososphaeraceae archaeon]|nr:hypothetical protein [Nitrososphaeraceae archaeon]
MIFAKNLTASKLKDYLIMIGIGYTIVVISLSTSAIEPTYGSLKLTGQVYLMIY